MKTAKLHRRGAEDAKWGVAIVLTSSPLDFELCELLGDKPADFICLLADGTPVPGYGTPYDSPNAREKCEYLCAKLNDCGKDSWFPEFLVNWGNELEKICPPESRPVFSFEIHRVCVGHAEYLHCAIGLFAKLGSRVSEWSVGVVHGLSTVEIVLDGKRFSEEGEDVALTICTVVARAMREMETEGSDLSTLNHQPS